MGEAFIRPKGRTRHDLHRAPSPRVFGGRSHRTRTLVAAQSKRIACGGGRGGDPLGGGSRGGAGVAGPWVGLIRCGWPPVEWLLSRPLEARYPVRPFRATPGLQAIVVFGSSISPPLHERPFPEADFETIERCAYAAWVYRQIGPAPVRACGGRASGRRLACAVAMRELLRQAGIPEDMIWTEEESRSTYENARFGAEILRRFRIDRVALVVDARSMPRAAAALEK